MPEYPPFMNAYGKLSRILDKVKQAKTPERFTYDFLEKTLGFKTSSDRAFIRLAKRIGFLASDGSPTELYKSFRNPDRRRSGAAMAQAIRKGYSALFDRNESVYKLNKQELRGLLMEITGLQKTNVTLVAIMGSFEALRSFADFEEKTQFRAAPEKEEKHEPPVEDRGLEAMGLNLSYIINLVLPRTDDIAVFNAIFKSLKENLLRK